MKLNRREFIAGTTALSLAPLASGMGVHQDKPTLKVGLIGCGGRGNGAIRNSFEAEKGAVLWAIGDAFQDRVDSTYDGCVKDLKDQCKIGDRKFTGFDAYQKVIESGVDIVILTTPPHFRPIHFEAAVKAGKHVFMEKPVAVDGPGVRAVMEAAKLAKSKKLTVVAGTQRRHDLGYQEVMKRIKGGDMGEIVQLNCWWNQGGLWMNPRQANWSDMEWQLRNWLYFAWLSGDHIVEQHVHNIDVCLWAMGTHPVKATCLGGRQVRTDPAYGHIFDHFATEYEFENGVKMMSQCRQIDGCASRVAEEIIGTKGRSNAGSSITGAKAFNYKGQKINPYVNEHARLYKSIRANEGFNEGVQVAESVLTAIMGRMSAYSGQEVTWAQALASNVHLGPTSYSMNASLKVAPVAVPGQTKDAF